MKKADELYKMLFEKLAELQDGRIKKDNPDFAKHLAIELGLLYDILGDLVPEEYWEEIEVERYWYIIEGGE